MQWSKIARVKRIAAMKGSKNRSRTISNLVTWDYRVKRTFSLQAKYQAVIALLYNLILRELCELTVRGGTEAESEFKLAEQALENYRH